MERAIQVRLSFFLIMEASMKERVSTTETLVSLAELRAGVVSGTHH